VLAASIIRGMDKPRAAHGATTQKTTIFIVEYISVPADYISSRKTFEGLA
jgi:hypothetical protein